MINNYSAVADPIWFSASYDVREPKVAGPFDLCKDDAKAGKYLVDSERLDLKKNVFELRIGFYVTFLFFLSTIFMLSAEKKLNRLIIVKIRISAKLSQYKCL